MLVVAVHPLWRGYEGAGPHCHVHGTDKAPNEVSSTLRKAPCRVSSDSLD